MGDDTVNTRAKTFMKSFVNLFEDKTKTYATFFNDELIEDQRSIVTEIKQFLESKRGSTMYLIARLTQYLTEKLQETKFLAIHNTAADYIANPQEFREKLLALAGQIFYIYEKQMMKVDLADIKLLAHNAVIRYLDVPPNKTLDNFYDSIKKNSAKDVKITIEDSNGTNEITANKFFRKCYVLIGEELIKPKYVKNTNIGYRRLFPNEPLNELGSTKVSRIIDSGFELNEEKLQQLIVEVKNEIKNNPSNKNDEFEKLQKYFDETRKVEENDMLGRLLKESIESLNKNLEHIKLDIPAERPLEERIHKRFDSVEATAVQITGGQFYGSVTTTNNSATVNIHK